MEVMIQTAHQSFANAVKLERLHKSHLRFIKLDSFVILLLTMTSLAVAEAATHPPKASAEETQSQLHEFGGDTIKKAGLAVTRIRVLPTIGAAEQPLHRGRLEFNVTGTPKAINDWLGTIQNPGKFRAITNLRISPKKEDDSLGDCQVELNQWFVPKETTKAPEELDEIWKRGLKKLSSGLSPVTVWEEIQKCMNGDPDLRLPMIEITVELEKSQPAANRIFIIGEGKTPSTVKLFGDSLKKSKSLEGYQWQIHPPEESKAGKWLFNASANSDKPSR